MPRGPRRSPWVFLLLPLLLLPPPPLLPGVSSADAEQTTRDRARPGWRDMQERLREAATLCKRYWEHFSCRLWPEDCDEETERSAPSCRLESPAAGPEVPGYSGNMVPPLLGRPRGLHDLQ